MYLAQKRLGLFIAIAGSGIMTFLIAFTNITDYATNFDFVKHVLSMDTIFENSTVKYRSISHDTFHHAAYIFIILLEAAISYFFISSAFQLYKHLKNDKQQFNTAKKNAYIGINLGLLLWFVGFTVVGGEWFAMWQSSEWNGLDAAYRINTFFILTYLTLVVVE
jgi:predicted small integral membrane protein